MKKIFDTILETLREWFGPRTFMAEPEISDVDLGVELDKKSVVDFLKLLEIDSSRANRAELAQELGVNPELKSGSASANEALRKAVFRKLADNGGNVPASLLD